MQGDNTLETGRTDGNASGSSAGNGGGFGALGGSGNIFVNPVYGNLMNPSEPGSGGGGGGGDAVTLQPGGNGGGVIKLTAPSLALNGSIVADGAESGSGAGSGGSIRLDVPIITGTGFVLSRGGNGGTSGAGGGRIAIYATSNALPAANISANGGKGGDGTSPAFNGGAGTVYLKLAAGTYGDLTIDNHGLDTSSNSTPLNLSGKGIVTVITSNSLIQSGRNWTPSALKGYWVNPNINQGVFFSIADNTTDSIFIDSSSPYLNSVAAVGDTYSGVYALNSLTLQGKARVYSEEQFNVAGDAIIDNATLVAGELYAGQTLLTNGGTFTKTPMTTP